MTTEDGTVISCCNGNVSNLKTCFIKPEQEMRNLILVEIDTFGKWKIVGYNREISVIQSNMEKIYCTLTGFSAKYFSTVQFMYHFYCFKLFFMFLKLFCKRNMLFLFFFYLNVYKNELNCFQISLNSLIEDHLI